MSFALRCSILSCLGAGLVLLSEHALSAPPNPTAPDLVRKALMHEIQGDAANRQKLLEEALKRDADYAPARWHLGQLKYQDQWQDYREIPLKEGQRPEVQEYLKRRQPLPTKAEDHLKLADWCRDNNLPLREQAHLIAALELSKNPNNVQLRARLGHQFVNGVWMTPLELAESLELAERIEAAAKKWRPRLELLHRQLQSPRKDLQEKARQELLAIDDPDVLPALEAHFSQKSLKAAELFVELLSQMKLVEANQYLARQAVLSPYVTIREEAALALRSQPVESYAPLLLEALHTPIQSKVGLFVSRGGVRLTHLLLSETQDVRQVAGLDSRLNFRRIPVLQPITRREFQQFGWSRSQADETNRALKSELLNKQLEAYAQQRAVDLKNEQLADWNERIFAALKKSVALDLPDDPKDWWKWWLDYNQLHAPDEKPIQYVKVVDNRERVLIDRVPRMTSCLVAGTPIWTDRGFVPVEQVQVGDLVLSKHPRTGELAYQPVLKTTVRPEAELVTARFGASEITCTLGHTFWISGKGWQKIRKQPQGSPFHSASSVAMLDPLEKAKPLPTYNLVVADFHTYFVGQDMILSHDPTFAEPLNNTVPGWPE